MKGISEYGTLDGLGMAELVRKGEVTASELLEEAIRRAEERNPRLNAIVASLYDLARDSIRAGLPDGPFTGVPFLVKDLLATLKGVSTSSGNRLLKNLPCQRDSEIVRRWKRSGVVILGKTNTPEFGLTPYTEPLTFGPARNPWDLSRTTGGSSGGSAAAVAARIVPLASGGDGGGSIRIPASACGLFGFKPTRARTPAGPNIGEAWKGLAIEHVLTRSVRDSAAMLDATEGPDVGAPYHAPPKAGPYLGELSKYPGRLRICWTGTPLMGARVAPEVLAALERTVATLSAMGHELVEAAPPVDRERFSLAYITVLAAELRADIEAAASAAGKRVSVADFDPGSFGLGMLGKAMSASEYAAASRYLMEAAREIGRFFEGCDLLLTPTLSEPPFVVGKLQPTQAEKALIRFLGSFDGGAVMKALGVIKPLAAKTFEFIPWTPVFNVTGQPAMSVPLAWSASGLPIGMHFVGRFGDEATLFRLAARLEEAANWDRTAPDGFGA